MDIFLWFMLVGVAAFWIVMIGNLINKKVNKK